MKDMAKVYINVLDTKHMQIRYKCIIIMLTVKKRKGVN